jgi:outer membrane protein assembly factor BamB
VGDHLIFMHRLGNEELVECLHPETGLIQWQFRYATVFEDRYGYNNGPRSSPVIDGERVYTVGAEGKLHCLELASGNEVWTRDLRAEYGVRQDFFGTASTPLVEGGLLIINVGAPNGPCVAGLDQATGREVWRAGDEWGPSYASPVPAVVHGERRVFVFAGGESSPPTGGLMSIEPTTGQVDFMFSFRSRTYESVNASCPVVFDNKVFISSSYRKGSALIDVRPDFTHGVAWTTPEFGLHFNTAIHRDGYLYGFDGRNEGDASLACIDAANGQVVWRETPTWTEGFVLNGQSRRATMGTGRGSLLAVDGQFLCLGELGHLLWMDLTPKGYQEVSRGWLVAARESWTLPVLSRGLLYVVQNTRDMLQGAGPRLLCYDLRA